MCVEIRNIKNNNNNNNREIIYQITVCSKIKYNDQSWTALKNTNIY
jgi:hypothetical protein